MPKQLNVNLAFTADTGQAQKSLNELQKSLQDIAKLPGKASSLFDDTEIKNASKAAMELQQHLNAAVNVKTGNLDLSRLSTSLKAAGKDLNSYYDQLIKIGPQGQETFLKLAKSISMAEAPVTRINSKLLEMGTTLKNTARWQISSSILHGFMGTLQSAYGYAQDLNESLNNIRIVTGQSVDEMAAFATQANKAAKELSTTTTAYTDAALIFYQQGLKGDAVTERTDTVIKLANVTKQSAEEVSSYMTAIWNNFDDGSVSLEHYADVITALGATTASSSAEIAEGLSKFASVADTIGLSYDYATSILSALVANTRQSADVIGTSLKTILARLQSVKLGETLDDGVELTKYTQALNSIGVSVLDLNGKLRDADDILEDTAAKWDTLTKAQQAGVAQTVAGTRQYAQFIAMMENWGDVQKNLQTAGNAEGTLQDQADIYAESWEAASKRVKAAAQSIYQNILDDNFFIDLTNGVEKVLTAINSLIKGFGGVKGVIFALSSIFLTNFAQKMPAALDNLRQNFMVLTGQAEKEMIKIQNKTALQLKLVQSSTAPESFKLQAEGIQKVNEMQQKLLVASKKMRQEEIDAYKARIQNVNAMYSEVAALQATREELDKEAQSIEKNIIAQSKANIGKTVQAYNKSGNKIDSLSLQRNEEISNLNSLKENGGSADEISQAEAKIQTYNQQIAIAKSKNDELKQSILSLCEALNLEEDEILSVVDANGRIDDVNMNKITSQIQESIAAYDEQINKITELENIQKEVVSQGENWKTFFNEFKQGSKEVDALSQNMQAYIAKLQQLDLPDNVRSELQELSELIEKGESDADTLIAKFQGIGTSISTGLDAQIDNLSADILQFEDTLSTLNLPPNLIQQFEQLCQKIADIQVKISSSKSNIGNAFGDPKAINKMSQSVTQFAGAVMSTYATINSISSLMKTFQDETATTSDIFGAILSSGMAVAMMLSQLISLAVALDIALWEVTLIVAAVVAICAGLAFIFNEVKNSSPEAQFKKSQAAAEGLATALENTKQKAEDLQSAFDKYDEVVQKLDDCTKGTQEWYDALEDVNQAVLDILQEFPELLEMEGAITRDPKTGMLSISEQGRDALQNQIYQRQQTLQSASLMANQQAKEDKLHMQASAFGASHQQSYVVGENVDYFNPGKYLEENLSELGNLTKEEFSTKLVEILKEPAMATGMTTAEFNHMIDSLTDCQDQINSLADSAEACATSLENTANIIADQNLGDEYSAAEKEIASEAYEKAYDSAYEKWKNIGAHDGTVVYDGISYEGVSQVSEYSSNKSVQAIWDAYNEALGTNYKMDTSNGVTGTDSNRAFQYLDDSGKLSKVTLEQVASTIAAAEALETLGSSADNASEKLANLEKNIGTEAAQGIENWISSGNFNSMSKQDFQDMTAKLDADKNGSIGQDEVQKYLEDAFGMSAEEIATLLGYDDVNSMTSEFLKDYGDTRDAFADISKDLGKTSKTVQGVYDNLVNSGELLALNVAQRQNFADLLVKAWAEGGEDAAKRVGQIFAKTGDDADEFADVLSEIDWNSTDVNALEKALKEAGVTTDFTKDELQELINIMGEDLVKSIDELAASFKNMNDVVSGLSDGDTISEEDFAALGDLGANYFARMMDGTYKLIGSAEELQKAVQMQGIADYQKNIGLLEEQNNNYKDIQGINYNDISGSAKTNGWGGFGLEYDEDKLNNQLDVLEKIGYSTEQLAIWREKLANGGDWTKSNVIKDVSTAIDENADAIQNVDEKIEENTALINQQQLAIALSYTSVKDLKQAYKDHIVTAQAFTTAMIELDEAADVASLDPQELKDYADYLQEAAKNMEDFNNEMSDDAARIVAKGIMKMNDAIDTLADNFKDWREVLEQSTEGSEEFSQAMIQTKDAVAGLLDISSEFITNDFITTHLDEISEAAKGDETAIDNLKSALADSIIAKVLIDNESFISDSEAVMTAYNELKENIPDIKIGTYLDNGDFIDGLNELIQTTGMSVDQVNALCDSLGFEANYKTEEQPTEYTVPIYTTYTRKTGETEYNGNTYDTVETWTEQTGEKKLEGEYATFGMAVSPDGSEAPIIEGVTKKATGSSNNYSSSNAGGKSPGKNSGGGSSKKKDTKDEKKYDDEFDRYHDINESLKELDHTMKMVDKQQSHLYGNELAASLRQENELIAQQTGLYEQKLAIQQQEQAELQAELATNGIAFDTATGQMLNYAEGTAQALKELNDAIKAYNASAQEEADKLVLEAAEKKYELFKKNLERYDSLLQEIRTNQENIQDNYYKEVENTLKAWEAEIQVKLDLAEAHRTWQKFINTISKDFKSVFRDVGKDMASIVEQAKTFMGPDGTIEQNITKLNHAEEFISQAQGLDPNSDSFKNLAKSYGYASISEAQEKLKEYNNDLQSSAEELYQLYEDAWDAYIEGIEQAIDKFDDLIDQYDRINDDLDHQSKMIELLYGDQAYDLLGQLYGAQANNLLGEMDSLRQQIDFYQSQYNHAVEKYGVDSEAAQKWKESWESAIDNLHGKEEDYIDTIKNQALNAITETFAALEKQLTGGDSLSWVSEQWEDALYAAEGYYDEVERIYQLESIEQKYKKAINDTSALKYQQQLKTLMDEQLSSLEGKTKLSEYDIELAEKRLAVYQAQIALEEAQNNKTSMKLTRGTDGNWSYQYVADDNDVMSKQEELLAKQQEYYEFTKQSWQDLTQKITEDTQTAIQRIQELEEESLTATTERQAEIAEQIEYLREYYWGEEGVITQEIAAHAEYENNLNQATAETLWALYETDLDNYSLMTDNEKALIDDLRDYGVTNFQTLYDAIAKNYDDIQIKCDNINAQSLNTWTTTANEMIRKWNSGDGDSIVYQVTQALNTCSQAVAQYAYMVQMGCAAAGENFANVGQMILYDQQATAALEGQTAQLVSTTCSNLLVYEQYLDQVQMMWDAVSARIRQATQDALNFLAVQGIVASVNNANSSSTSGSPSSASSSNNNNSNKNTGTLDNDTAWGIATAIWTEGDSGWYNNPVRSQRINEKFGDGAYEQVQSIINEHSANGDLYSYWKKNLGGDASQFHYNSFATGGYTGDWDGGDGRLAVLHSKELVLNENDTKNILSVVDSVRNIASLGGSITASIANGIGNMVSSLMGLGNNNKYNYNTNNNDGNNTFEITMNVDGGDVKEIQQAILNLPNLASQYLSRK